MGFGLAWGLLSGVSHNIVVQLENNHCHSEPKVKNLRPFAALRVTACLIVFELVCYNYHHDSFTQFTVSIIVGSGKTLVSSGFI